MDSHISIFKALGDETRLRVVAHLNRVGEAPCSDISGVIGDLSQPTLSHHFKVLHEAGIIDVRKEGVSCYYALNKNRLKDLGVDTSKL
jgi:ArsR family transcriptional regulator, arsenate/arsenite/antimonite-responsive transcriptional repressor